MTLEEIQRRWEEIAFTAYCASQEIGFVLQRAVPLEFTDGHLLVGVAPGTRVIREYENDVLYELRERYGITALDYRVLGPPGAASYAEYLRSEGWQRGARASRMAFAGGRCEVCSGNDGLNVHHRTYERIGREWMQDVVVLCRLCHALFHKGGRLARPQLREVK